MATDAEETDTRRNNWRERPQVVTALGLGAVLTLIGILGFILEPVEGQLFGIFGVNTLHNAVHFLTGVGGLAAGYYAAGGFSDEYNKYGGLAYLLLFALWFVLPGFLNALLNIGLPDTILHLGLGIIAVAVGFGVADRLG